MIPTNRAELDVIAGEFVLGVLEPDAARDVKAALDVHAELRRTVAFWEEQLHPLSRLVPGVDPPERVWRGIADRLNPEPPENMWSRIAARLGTMQSASSRSWNSLRVWQAATATAVAVAVYCSFSAMMSHVTEDPGFVAVLHAPHGEEPEWIATTSQDTLLLRAVKAERPPVGRAFELWVIPANAKPQSLGVIPPEGRVQLAKATAMIRDGATLAISIEPVAGSPTGQPTGPVVFAGTVVAAR